MNYDTGGAGYDEEGVGSATSPSSAEPKERMVTKDAYVTSEVDSGKFKDAESEVKSAISSFDAILLNEDVNLYKSGESAYYSGSYRIKVESSKYGQLVDRLKKIGELEDFSEVSVDITEQYTKLDVELAVEKQRLERYQDLYRSAGTVKEKVELSDRIFDQERRIEYLVDAMKDVSKRVTYNTVSVSLREERPAFYDVALVKLSVLVENLVDGFNSLLRMVTFLFPYAVFGFICWRLWRLFKHRKR